MTPERNGQPNIVMAKLQELVAWGRKNSLWPFGFGTSCCFVEFSTALTSVYDMARFGSEVIRSSPREADVMFVAGTVFVKAAPMLKYLHDQMMAPKWVVSMGSCANSGGMFDVYSVVQGVDRILPVDVYIPGCPPRPDAVLESLILLQKVVGSERRPLSWVMGEQGVIRPETTPERDRKREERRKMTDLRPPTEI